MLFKRMKEKQSKRSEIACLFRNIRYKRSKRADGCVRQPAKGRMNMHKHRINDENFIEEMKKKNEEALRYLIEKYGSLVMAVIRKRLYLMEEEQEECFDDVFLRVWEHIGEFDRQQGSFTSWIAGIARYRAIDYLRRYRRGLEEVPLDEAVADGRDRVFELIEKELSEGTEAILAYLKPEERELFEKLFVEEMTVKEVCEITGVREDTVYKRISRVRKRMRKLFPGCHMKEGGAR